MTITVRYGAQRQQFGPAEGHEIAVLDYSSQQLKLMPMLATCYALHFTAAFLVEQYTQAKRTKEEELVADVHSLSAGPHPSAQHDWLRESAPYCLALIGLLEWSYSSAVCTSDTMRLTVPVVHCARKARFCECSSAGSGCLFLQFEDPCYADC